MREGTYVASYVELAVDGSKYSDLNFVGNGSTEVWHPQGGTVLLGIGGASPSAPVQCYIDGRSVANDQCLLTFEDSGLYFDVPDTTSAKNSDDFALYAVKKDTQTQQCQALFSNENKGRRLKEKEEEKRENDVTMCYHGRKQKEKGWKREKTEEKGRKREETEGKGRKTRPKKSKENIKKGNEDERIRK